MGIYPTRLFRYTEENILRNSSVGTFFESNLNFTVHRPKNWKSKMEFDGFTCGILKFQTIIHVAKSSERNEITSKKYCEENIVLDGQECCRTLHFT